MTGFASEFITLLASTVYDLLDSIKLPGTNYTILLVLLSVAFFKAAVVIIKGLTGTGISLAGRGFRQRGGNNKSYKISNERKGDTK